MTAELLFQQLLNGLSFAAILFLLAAGLTLIFGLMDIVNLAHGAFYLIGGYLGLTAVRATGNFWLGILAGAVGLMVVGLFVERILLRPVRGQPLPEVLLTLGLAILISDQATVIWGTAGATSIPRPDYLSGSVDLLGVPFSRYRMLMILGAVVVWLLLHLLYTRTKFGAIVRAGVDDREMITALGINIKRVFTGAFIFGAALAGIGGVAGGAVLGLLPGAEVRILLLALAVVIIGGIGTLGGAVAGSVFVGVVTAFGQVFFPELTFFTLFAPMALILIFRPQGVLGRAA